MNQTWSRNLVSKMFSVYKSKRNETRGFANRPPCRMRLNYKDAARRNRVKYLRRSYYTQAHDKTHTMANAKLTRNNLGVQHHHNIGITTPCFFQQERGFF